MYIVLDNGSAKFIVIRFRNKNSHSGEKKFMEIYSESNINKACNFGFLFHTLDPHFL